MKHTTQNVSLAAAAESFSDDLLIDVHDEMLKQLTGSDETVKKGALEILTVVITEQARRKFSGEDDVESWKRSGSHPLLKPDAADDIPPENCPDCGRDWDADDHAGCGEES